VKYNHCLFY